MLVIEIPPNPNCEPVDMRVFHDLEPPRAVTGVRLERALGHPQWHEVTGWTQEGQPCLALAQKVDDSGEGVAYLIHGGDAGLRLRPSRGTPPQLWGLDYPEQWGEPFLLIADPSDLQLRSA